MKSDRRPAPRRTPLNQDTKRLKRHRLAARLTITEAAGNAGCSVPYLWQLEQGDYSASADKLTAIAGAYGCKITDLMPADVADRARNGQYDDDPRMLGAIADAIGCTVLDLIPDETEPARPKTAALPEQDQNAA